jgi:hypothetical protein
MGRPGRFTPKEETRYPLYRGPCGPQDQSEWVRKKSPHRKSIPGPSCSQRIAIPIALFWLAPLMVIKRTLCYYFVGDLLASEVDADGRCVNSHHAKTCVRAYELCLHMNTFVTCSVQCKKL